MSTSQHYCFSGHFLRNIVVQLTFIFRSMKHNPATVARFCFPDGVQTQMIQRTNSLSQLNELLLAQPHNYDSQYSHVFRLTGNANDDGTSSILYGICVTANELVEVINFFHSKIYY